MWTNLKNAGAWVKVKIRDKVMEFTREFHTWIYVFENRVSSLLSDVHAFDLARFF